MVFKLKLSVSGVHSSESTTCRLQSGIHLSGLIACRAAWCNRNALEPKERILKPFRAGKRRRHSMPWELSWNQAQARCDFGSKDEEININWKCPFSNNRNRHSINENIEWIKNELKWWKQCPNIHISICPCLSEKEILVFYTEIRKYIPEYP